MTATTIILACLAIVSLALVVWAWITGKPQRAKRGRHQ